jgi:hypothetical protein
MSDSLAPYVQAVGQLITWVLVIAGWYWVSRSNDRRETRKELRSLIDGTRSLIGAIESTAYEYYGLSVDEAATRGMFLKRDFARLARRLSTLKAANPAFDHETQLVAFRQCGARASRADGPNLS